MSLSEQVNILLDEIKLITSQAEDESAAYKAQRDRAYQIIKRLQPVSWLMECPETGKELHAASGIERFGPMTRFKVASEDGTTAWMVTVGMEETNVGESEAAAQGVAEFARVVGKAAVDAAERLQKTQEALAAEVETQRMRCLDRSADRLQVILDESKYGE